MKSLAPTPFQLPYQGVAPRCGVPCSAALGAAVLGRVTLGENAELGPFAVLRADGHVIEVGRDFSIGARSTVHISHEKYGAYVGQRVSVGANAVVHACTVEDDCVVLDDACLLDGSVLGRGCVLAKGSVVAARAVLPAGHWCAGNPAVPVRPLESGELAQLHQHTRAQTRLASGLATGTRWSASAAAAPGFVAATVTGVGELRMAQDSSVWFGCVVDAAAHGVDVGARSNVQDNSLLRSRERTLVLGADCTVGHNVQMHDCTVGDRVLLGMGSVLASGTVVHDDVLLAAGSTTEPAQVLHGGWLWRGQPAVPVARLDDRKIELIAQSALMYGEYMHEFAAAQQRLLALTT